MRKNRILWAINGVIFVMMLAFMSGVNGPDGEIQWLAVLGMFACMGFIGLFCYINKDYIDNMED